MREIRREKEEELKAQGWNHLHQVQEKYILSKGTQEKGAGDALLKAEKEAADIS